MKQDMQPGGLDVLRGERAHRCRGRPRSLCLTCFSPCPSSSSHPPAPSPAVLCPLVATSPPFLKLIQYFLMLSFIFGFLAIPLCIVCFSSTPGRHEPPPSILDGSAPAHGPSRLRPRQSPFTKVMTAWRGDHVITRTPPFFPLLSPDRLLFMFSTTAHPVIVF